MFARVGDPVTLCWRLERSNSATGPLDSSSIRYVVYAEVGFPLHFRSPLWIQKIRMPRQREYLRAIKGNLKLLPRCRCWVAILDSGCAYSAAVHCAVLTCLVFYSKPV